ncbi:sugar-binding protein, partial [Streptomyces sp. ventii]|nr:sugar-binding protein [Streptomyces spiramenti]
DSAEGDATPAHLASSADDTTAVATGALRVAAPAAPRGTRAVVADFRRTAGALVRTQVTRALATVPGLKARKTPAELGIPPRAYHLSGTVPVGELLPEATPSARPDNGDTGSDASSDASTAAPSTASGAVHAALPAQSTAAAAPRVVGVLDTGSSAGGDFNATPLLSAGSWAAGSSSGAFTYTYPLELPEAPGGLTPSVGFGYSSQSVDGRTSASNNQSSWIGDGWDYNAGSVTRTYVSCTQDAEKSGANNSSRKTGDLCWGSHNATLSLGGTTTELVRDDATGVWTTSGGDNSKVELLKDTALGNGDADGEYWRVTTTDGTRYWFGRNRLPGWTSGRPETQSVLTVPVAGNHPGEPCYKAGDFAGSFCDQAWRWSLDYVEDVHGNAMSLWWARETNHYAKNLDYRKPVAYHRGGHLRHIDYGQRADSVYSSDALARVTFTVAERCFAEGSATCTDDAFTSGDPGRYRIWYDTPASLYCKPNTTCWNGSPAFFSRKRLATVTTSAQRQEGTTARQNVDRYRFTQSFPLLRTGANTALWLESITRTGFAVNGTTSTSLAPVRFEPNVDAMPNRVVRGPRDPRPGFDRLRVGRVINEYGGESVVTYSTPTGPCAAGENLPTPQANTQLCYPVHWHPDPESDDLDWFHKYVVTAVEELPAVDGSYPVLTEYEYGTPAWRLTQQEFSKKTRRTYSDFGGFDLTTVYSGVEDELTGARRSKAVTRYFQGRGDDVTVRDVEGNAIAPDREAFAGRIAEELSYDAHDAPAGRWLTRSVTVPEATRLAQRDRGDGLTPLRAWRVTEPTETSWTRSSGTGDDKRTLRTLRTNTTYETTHGLPTRVESLGDTGRTGDESCTRLEYHHVASAHVIGLTRQALTSPTTCADADFADLTTLTDGARVGYDGNGYGTAPTKGLASQSWSLKADGSGFQNDGTSAFDNHGRVVSMTDPDGNTGTLTYTPATGQAYRLTETNTLGHKQTTQIEPGRAAGIRVTDANGHTSSSVYDPLGRLVEAWGVGRTPSAAAVPDLRVTYHITAGKPPAVTTRHRGHNDTVRVSTTLYDGLGRERQTQEHAVGGGRLITDTLTNPSGEIRESRNAYHAEGTPSTTLFTPDTVVPNATRYTYDSVGRVLTEMPVLNGEEDPAKAVRYSYGPDHATVINPDGAASYRVYDDALGRTVRVDTFTDTARTEYVSSRYEYDETGALTRATDTEGNAWSWSYDQRGRLTAATDPDAGTARYTYDHLDRPVTSTDARGVTLWTGYDRLSRPLGTRRDSSTGELLGTYTYDTAPGGIGLPATATRYTDGLPYGMSVGGYTPDYQPTSSTLTLPAEIARHWGLAESYTYGYEYTDTGLLRSTQLPAIGGLKAEKLLVRYTADGLPLTVSGSDWYASETIYSPYGHVLRSALGAHPYRVWATADYDEATGELREQRTYREQRDDAGLVPGFLASHRSYRYDPAGNVTAIREHAGNLTERQCFTYDPLGQLTEAWTSGEQTSCTAPGQSGAAPHYPDGTSNVAKGRDLSGYWHSYRYDTLGNRTELTRHDLDGDTAGDAVTSYRYGEGGATGRALTSVESNFRTAQGALIKAVSQRTYDAAGNTTTVSDGGDTQTLSWTPEGDIDRVSGPGSSGAVPYLGPGDKCLDLRSAIPEPGQAVQLYGCNATAAQKFTFTPAPGQSDADLGTLTVVDHCLHPAAGTRGAAVEVQPCDDTADQLWQRTAGGQLVHHDSGLCAAVSGGQTANSTPVVLAACDAAATAQQWYPQGEVRYVYGPDGGRVLTLQDRQAVLNLGEAEVTVLRGGTLVSTQRTYAGPGGAVMRYADGTGASRLVALTSDHQGTPYTETAMQAGMQVRVRKQDPFGGVRAASTTSPNLRTHLGFLGATRDDATGYVQLGARTYDPAIGRFLSLDPVLDIADPLQANGYAYAHNNPVTHADPTGLAISLTGAERTAALAAAGLTASQVAGARAAQNKSLQSVIMGAAWSVLKEFIGINDAVRCFNGDLWGCGAVILNAIPWTKLFKVASVARAINRSVSAISAWRKAKAGAGAILSRARLAESRALRVKQLNAARARAAAQLKRAKAAAKKNTVSNKATTAKKKTGNPVQKKAAGRSNPKATTAPPPRISGGGGGGASRGGSSGGTSKASASRPAGSTGAGSRAGGGGNSGNGGAGKVQSAGSGGDCPTNPNSFVPGTRVLMADGSSKPIEDIQVGDRVLATDPETGETRAETVTAEILGNGEKLLVDVTVETDDGEREVISATGGHPFWVPELDAWTDAEELQPGQWLRTSAGTHVQITALTHHTTTATVHNLTVNNLHTYYVLAGVTPVLVHNCQVEYGSTDLSQAVIQERLKLGNKANNFAAARYADSSGAEQVMVAFSSKGRGNHAEQKLIRAIGKDDISEIYSELQPCRNSCAPAVAGIRTTWSWNWTTSAEGAVSRKSQLAAVRGAFAGALSGNW